jgi:hypothetical protein
MKRVSVVTQGGKLVGVYVPPPSPSDPKAPVVRLVAGPRQKIQEISIEAPARLARHEEVEAFHALVRKRLKLRK